MGKRPLIKLLLLGKVGGGKTSIALKYMHNLGIQADTADDTYTQTIQVNNQPVQLELYDPTASEVINKPLYDLYIKNACVCSLISLYIDYETYVCVRD